MKTVIKASQLSRWYGIVMGLNHVQFEITAGLTGLVGPNGAGKSTLINLITGQLRPSSGTLEVLGYRPWNNAELARCIGYCPEGEAVHQDLSPLAWLTALGRLSGLSRSELRQSVESRLQQVNLAPKHWRKPLSQFSKGMRQRVKLAQALLHDPQLLVLDEPMNGLDPMGRQEVAQVLRMLAENGKSILISSHILSELEALCPSFLILNWGKVLAVGTRRQIRDDLRRWSEEVLIRCDDPERLAGLLFAKGYLLGFDLDLPNQSVRVRLKDPKVFYHQWLDLLGESGITAYEVRSESRSLHQIFEKVTT